MFPRTGKESNINRSEKRKRNEDNTLKFDPPRVEVSYDLRESFLFNELSMIENIWVNISSEESLTKGGLTN